MQYSAWPSVVISIDINTDVKLMVNVDIAINMLMLLLSLVIVNRIVFISTKLFLKVCFVLYEPDGNSLLLYLARPVKSDNVVQLCIMLGAFFVVTS